MCVCVCGGSLSWSLEFVFKILRLLVSRGARRADDRRVEVIHLLGHNSVNGFELETVLWLEEKGELFVVLDEGAARSRGAKV